MWFPLHSWDLGTVRTMTGPRSQDWKWIWGKPQSWMGPLSQNAVEKVPRGKKRQKTSMRFLAQEHLQTIGWHRHTILYLERHYGRVWNWDGKKNRQRGQSKLLSEPGQHGRPGQLGRRDRDQFTAGRAFARPGTPKCFISFASFNFTAALKVTNYYPTFTLVETEAKKSWRTSPKSQSW